MQKEFWVGTSPFCKGEKADCGRTPGYVCVGEDKSGDGFPCLTGKKVHCKFDPEEFKKSWIYNESVKNNPENKDFQPEFKWFGTSPYCKETYGSVAQEGYYPVKTDKSGDGAPCVVGSKVLGMRPVTKEQKETVEKLAKEYKEKNEKLESIIKDAIGILTKVVA